MNKLLLLAFLVTLLALAIVGTQQEEEASRDKTVSEPRREERRADRRKERREKKTAMEPNRNEERRAERREWKTGKTDKQKRRQKCKKGGSFYGTDNCKNGRSGKSSKAERRRKKCKKDGSWYGTKKCEKGRKGKPKEKKKDKLSQKKDRPSRVDGRPNGRQGCRSSSVNATCLDNAMSYLKLMKDAVANFETQDKRVSSFNKTGASKAGKKGLFAPVLSRIVDAGGGNTSNLTCGGLINAGSAQLTNLSNTLISCETDIHDACDTGNFPTVNETKMAACRAANMGFGAMVKTCMAMNGSYACNCWVNSTFATYATTIRSSDCKISSHNNETKYQMKACKTVFQKCRKYEDASLVAISSCHKTAPELLFKAKTLTANKAALTEAKATASALANGTSSTGRRSRRQVTTTTTTTTTTTAGSMTLTCAEVVTKVTELNKLTGEDATSSKIPIIATELTSSTLGACSDTEKTSLSSQVTSLDKSLAFLQNLLDMYLVQLDTQSGSTPTVDAIAAATTAGAATTVATNMMSTAAGRRQNIVAQHLMARLNRH